MAAGVRINELILIPSFPLDNTTVRSWPGLDLMLKCGMCVCMCVCVRELRWANVWVCDRVDSPVLTASDR